MERGAHQDGDFGKGVAVAAQRLRAVAHHAGLLVGIPQADHVDLFSGGIVAAGAQGFAQAAFVVRDQPGSSCQDGGGGTVIALESDNLGAGEVLLETQNVFHFCAAPGVDGLIVVTDTADVFMLLGQ